MHGCDVTTNLSWKRWFWSPNESCVVGRAGNLSLSLRLAQISAAACRGEGRGWGRSILWNRSLPLIQLHAMFRSMLDASIVYTPSSDLYTRRSHRSFAFFATLRLSLDAKFAFLYHIPISPAFMHHIPNLADRCLCNNSLGSKCIA